MRCAAQLAACAGTSCARSSAQLAERAQPRSTHAPARARRVPGVGRGRGCAPREAAGKPVAVGRSSTSTASATSTPAHGIAGGDRGARCGPPDHLPRPSRETTDHVGRTGPDELTVLPARHRWRSRGAVVSRQRLVPERASEGGRPFALGGVLSVSAGVAEHRRRHQPGASCSPRRCRRAGPGAARRRRPRGRRRRGRAAGGPAGEEPLSQPASRRRIEALAVTLLERDRYTGEHSSRSSRWPWPSPAAGRRRREIEHVGAAALLHDIGKVAIPDASSTSPGRSTTPSGSHARAPRHRRAHPAAGSPASGPWRRSSATSTSATTARLPRRPRRRRHPAREPDHPRLRRLPRDDHDRPYRAHERTPRRSPSSARCAGTQFDPNVTEALIGVLHGLRQQGQPQRGLNALAGHVRAKARDAGRGLQKSPARRSARRIRRSATRLAG